jgi:hypothetical protein
MHACHDKLDFVVHCLVERLGLFTARKIDIGRKRLKVVEIVICQAIKRVSLNLSVVLFGPSALITFEVNTAYLPCNPRIRPLTCG